MITPKEAYEQATVSKKEVMDRFEIENPEIIEKIEIAIDEGINSGKIYTYFDSIGYSSDKVKEITDYLHFLGYDAEHNLQRESIWINWSQ